MKNGLGLLKLEHGATAPACERQRHALWAGLFALLLSLPMLLEPIDWLAWTVQSRLNPRPPSGDIAFVRVDNPMGDNAAAQRIRIAWALDVLRKDQAKAVFVDVVFDRPTSAEADSKLRKAVEAWGQRIAFVDRIEQPLSGRTLEWWNSADITGPSARVMQPISAEWPPFTWVMPVSYDTERGLMPSFAAALAGEASPAEKQFRIDYRIPSTAISTYDLNWILSPSSTPQRSRLSGKTVVIGYDKGATSKELQVPGRMHSPPSHVAIQAAETLKAGEIRLVPGYVTVLVLTLVLALAARLDDPLKRRPVYLATLAIPVVAFFGTVALGLQVELSYSLPLLLGYFVLRSRSSWKERVGQTDPDTGLPTLRAFARRIRQHQPADRHVVVAKIHGYETILKSLDSAQRAAYVGKLVKRLRVGDPRLAVYVEGHYLAWLVDQDDEAKLLGHLEGLRAIFAAPVTVDGHSIDVGITFGAARVDNAHRDRCLPAALAAVEETSEALEPVKLAAVDADNDSLWDLSLRARIDAAMEAGEVFCVYQPKMDIDADRIVGVEALVRWEDPDRGFIPPLHFVMQCEKAGRMEYLTRYVLQSACSAGKLLHFRGSRITMSVNISATLLSDMRIVGIVRNVIQATGFDARYLVLEITETARIRDLVVASAVLRALKALGAHISMDDFGSGSANFETLQALPFDEIKIDRQFVSMATTNYKARAITASIVGLGTEARLVVVAEGAETESDLRMLREIGCWQVQGYALARPMPLAKLLTFIASAGEDAQTAMI